jgi:hypothetical protein
MLRGIVGGWEKSVEALAVLWAPVRTLSRVAEERRVLLAFGVTALYAALGLISAALVFLGGSLQEQFEAQGQPLPPGFEDFVAAFSIIAIILAVLTPFVYWLLVAGLMHLVTRFFGGSGPFSGTLAVVGVAQAPLVVSSVLAIPLTGLQIALMPQDAAAADPSLGLAGTLVGLASGLIGLAAFLWFAAHVLRPPRRVRGVGGLVRHLVRRVLRAYNHRLRRDRRPHRDRRRGLGLDRGVRTPGRRDSRWKPEAGRTANTTRKEKPSVTRLAKPPAVRGRPPVRRRAGGGGGLS